MTYITVTPSLSEAIRTGRQRKNLKGQDLANLINKSPAYISQIENGRVGKVNLEDLDLILKKIMENSSDEEYEDYKKNLLTKIAEEIPEIKRKKTAFMLSFELEIRKILIPESLISLISEELIKLKLSPEDLVDIINTNQDLKNTERLPDKFPKNKLIITFENNNKRVKSYIEFDLPRDFITKILKKDINKTSYINMEGIIFYLLKTKGMDSNIARTEARRILSEHNFLTLSETVLKIEKVRKDKEEKGEQFKLKDTNIEGLPEYLEAMNEFRNLFHQYRALDIDLATKKLKVINNNILSNALATLPLISFDFTMIYDHLPNDQIQQMIGDFKETYQKYYDKSITKTEES